MKLLISSSSLHSAIRSPHESRRHVIMRSESGNNPGGMSEDMLERLRKAEREAAALRDQLASLQQQNPNATAASSSSSPTTPKRRIDGADLKRETILMGGSDKDSKRRNWLTESEVDFFTGGGPSELESADSDDATRGTVTKRLLIGVAMSALLGGLALIPDKTLNKKPTQPLFFYLVPVLRSLSLLESELGPFITNADWEQVQRVLRLIRSTPNNLRDNLDAAAAYLDDGQAYQKAKELETDIFEYLDGCDALVYFDAVKTPSKGSNTEQEYVAFATDSLRAAKDKIKVFLELMNDEQLSAARSQLAAFNTN